MNESKLHGLRLAALSPLLAAASTFDTAIAMAAVLFGTLVFTAAIGSITRGHVQDNQRPIALALVAAVVATALDQLLQAFCYRIAQPLHGWLPLLAVLPVLFDRMENQTRSSIASSRNALFQAAAMSIGLFAGTALRSLLPLEAGIAACLIASGLALAVIERYMPSTSTTIATEIRKPRTRARVTGPLR